ncbi:MAG: hypothetical protein M3383_03625 [Actinomycetota bacterium]|nr:hypothetical protein [Actinomycetota bacterium]
MAEKGRTATGEHSQRLRLDLELERAAPAHRGDVSPRSADLCVCPACARDLVYPLEWTPSGAHHWHVSLRCPDCEWRGAGVYGQDLIDRFDDAMDEGTQAVLGDLERLSRANMDEDTRHFIAALDRDLILPEDF